MYIKSLELKNYRNYENLCINISPGTNILYGDNAQGKTNILEALYLAGTTKSHRGSKDREIIQFDREEAHIRMMVERNGSTHKIDMHLKKNKDQRHRHRRDSDQESSRTFRHRESCGILSGRPEYYQKRAFREEKIYGFGTLSVK